MMALDGGRIGMAAQALGICEAAIAASVKYMGERVQFGKPIGKNQGLQWYLADMATRTEAAKALILEAAVAADNGQPLSKLAAMCKYYALRTPSGSPTRPFRSTAATATCGTTPSSACTATHASSPSTRAPPRSRRWSSHARS